MAIARTIGTLIGTDESTGVPLAVADTVNTAGAEVDLLADNASMGILSVYLAFTTPTPGPTKGDIRVTVRDVRAGGGQAFVRPNAGVFNLPAAGAAAATRHYWFVGRLDIGRYIEAAVTNNTNVALANVSLLYVLEKMT